MMVYLNSQGIDVLFRVAGIERWREHGGEVSHECVILTGPTHIKLPYLLGIERIIVGTHIAYIATKAIVVGNVECKVGSVNLEE
jgi:hypothetical protein